MLTRARAAVTAAPEVPILLAIVAAAIVLPHAIGGTARVRVEDIGIGIAGGAPLALQAIGMLLVYRTNRIVNFAQASLGLLSGLLFYELWANGVFISLWGHVCGCMADPAFAPWGWQMANFMLSLVAGLLAGPLVGGIVYLLVIRPLENSPRLVLTMLTVALAYLVETAAAQLIGHLSSALAGSGTQGGGSTAKLPLDVVVQVGSQPFHLQEWMGVLLVIAAATAVALLFRRTTSGVVLRAAADDMVRAKTLGVPVNRLKALVWAGAAALSGLAAILAGMAGTPPTPQPGHLEDTVLVQLLAIIVIARLRSIPVAILAAFCLGVVQSAFTVAFSNQIVYLGILFPLICGFLLLQRRGTSRADQEAASSWHAADEIRPIPPQLRVLPSVRHWLFVLGGAGGLLLLAYPWIMGPAQTTFGSQLLCYLMVMLSLLALSGWAGQISLGQFALAAVGSFVTTVLVATYGVPWIVAVILGGVAGTAVAMIIAIPAFRLPGLFLAVVTLALNIDTTAVFLDPRALGRYLPDNLARPVVFGLDTSDERYFFYLMAVMAAFVVFAMFRIRRSRPARALIATRDNEAAAQSFGVNLFRARLQAFALSGFLAALAGGFFALAQHGTHPPDFAVNVSLTLFLLTILGGLGSVWGPVIAVVFYAVVDLLLPSYADLIVSGGVILLFLFVPAGVGGAVFRVRDAILRRVAVRNKIRVPSLLEDSRDDGRPKRAKIAPRFAKGTAAVAFVPLEYRVGEQWTVPPEPGAR